MSRRGIVAAVLAVAAVGAGPVAAIEREHIGRYSTPEMADLIVYVPTFVAPVVAVEVAPAVAAPILAPEVRSTPVALEPVPVAPAIAPQPGDVITDDPDAGPYTYDPEQPNEGRGNGAGGWEPEPVEP